IWLVTNVSQTSHWTYSGEKDASRVSPHQHPWPADDVIANCGPQRNAAGVMRPSTSDETRVRVGANLSSENETRSRGATEPLCSTRSPCRTTDATPPGGSWRHRPHGGPASTRTVHSPGIPLSAALRRGAAPSGVLIPSRSRAPRISSNRGKQILARDSERML